MTEPAKAYDVGKHVAEPAIARDPRERGFVTSHNKRLGMKQFTKWKAQILDEMLKDDELTRLLYYNKEDCLSRPELTEEQKSSLIGTSIYNRRFIPDVAGTRKSFISLEFSHWQPFEGFRIFSNEYIHGFIYFYILCDVSIMDTDYGSRQDLILARIYDIFEEYSGLGLGNMLEETQLPLWIDNNSYGGYTIGFKVTEFK